MKQQTIQLIQEMKDKPSHVRDNAMHLHRGQALPVYEPLSDPRVLTKLKEYDKEKYQTYVKKLLIDCQWYQPLQSFIPMPLSEDVQRIKEQAAMYQKDMPTLGDPRDLMDRLESAEQIEAKFLLTWLILTAKQINYSPEVAAALNGRERLSVLVKMHRPVPRMGFCPLRDPKRLQLGRLLIIVILPLVDDALLCDLR